MSLGIDSSIRLFNVVGAAYVPEHRFDNHDDNSKCCARRSGVRASRFAPVNIGGWLQDRD
jgi:hypothetical protein